MKSLWSWKRMPLTGRQMVRPFKSPIRPLRTFHFFKVHLAGNARIAKWSDPIRKLPLWKGACPQVPHNLLTSCLRHLPTWQCNHSRATKHLFLVCANCKYEFFLEIVCIVCFISRLSLVDPAMRQPSMRSAERERDGGR